MYYFLLAFFFLIYTPIQGAQEAPLKLYSFYTPSHAVFKDKWFLPTLKDNFEVRIRFYPQECAQAQWMRAGWTDTTFHKIELILDAIEENWNTIFIYADIDIQFFQPMELYIRQEMENKDMLFQRHNPQGTLCSGFFVCRANEKTRALFLTVKSMMENNKKCSDQPAINCCLINKNNPYDIIWDYLPNTFFGGGTTTTTHKAWRPGTPLSIPDDIVLHHANCTHGIDNKIKQLKYVQKEVNKQQRTKKNPTY